MVKGARVLMCRWIVELLDKLRIGQMHIQSALALTTQADHTLHAADGGAKRGGGGDVLELR
jgi:hypothetical protein